MTTYDQDIGVALALSAKMPLSEQGDVKEEGIDLLVMPDD